MLYFLGDNHGHTDYILPTLNSIDKSTKTVFFLGDITLEIPLIDYIKELQDNGVRAYFIHGNHDTDKDIYWQSVETASEYNIDGKVIEVDNGAGNKVRIAGLGGVFRESIWSPDNYSLDNHNFDSYEDFIKKQFLKMPPRQRELKNIKSHRKHLSSIFPDVYNNLSKQKADILITHEAPSCHKYGFFALDILADAMGVKKIFHGHHHENIIYPKYSYFDVYSVGLREIMTQKGELIEKPFEYR